MTAEDASGHWCRVGAADDFEGVGPYAVSADGTDLVIVRTESGLRAFEGLCPHRGALLGEGELEGQLLVCRNHRWKFDVDSGVRDGGSQCLQSYPVRTENGDVLIDLSHGKQSLEGGQSKRQWRDLAGPRGLPIIGNAHQLSVPRLHHILEEWSSDYGPCYRFRVAGTRALVISDAELANRALRARPGLFRRSSKIEALFRELGIHGVFSAEGESWRPQRRLAMAALSHKNLVSFYPVLHTVTQRMLEHWKRMAASGEVIDIQEDLMRFTVDVTTTLAFGRDVNTIDGGEDVIQNKIRPIFPALARRLNATIPYWRWFKLPRDRELDRALVSLRGWMKEIIDETRAKLAASGPTTEPANFLEHMLTLSESSGEIFDEDTIMANALTMLVAGEDTTANTMAWAIHHLCGAPDTVAALREETQSAFGSSSSASSIEIAKALPTVQAVVNETMRLRPVAPLIILEANSDTVLGSLEIKKGELTFLLMRLPCLDPALGDDAGEFRPQRWLGTDDERLAKLNAVNMPFGSGPRICPGRSLALLEMRVLLSMLYHCFDVERVGSPEDVSELFNFTMNPVGLRARLHPR